MALAEVTEEQKRFFSSPFAQDPFWIKLVQQQLKSVDRNLRLSCVTSQETYHDESFYL
jgi:hypothetical protein